MKRFKIMLNKRHFLLSLLAIGLVIAYFVMPLHSWSTLALAGGLGVTLTKEQEEQQKELLSTIEAKVKKLIEDSTKENVSKADLDKKVKELNDEIAKLTNEERKELKDKVDKLSSDNEALTKELNESKESMKNLGQEIQKLKDKGIQNEEKPKSFREALKDAIMVEKDKVLKEVKDDNGERLSMKDYFNAGNKMSPKFTVKVAVDMLESNIVQNNVATVRLTQLDPNRVGIPLTIYPHVTDVFNVKAMSRPYMSLLVVYSYEDGAGTKTEGSASSKSSFLFKTVEFKAFYIATHFILSDETLDDLEEALDEISITAPDKIRDNIDSQVLGSAGDDATALAGILTANKHTAFSNPLNEIVEDAYIVDVIAAAKLQCQNNKYRPNLVYMSPEDIVLLAAKKNTFEDSKSDRRVFYNTIGEPTAVCGLLIVTSTAINQGEMIIIDNRQPWIGRRKDMTMEIGYNGTDLTEGQKTVVIKVRIAFGVRDKAGVIYVDDISAAVEALQST